MNKYLLFYLVILPCVLLSISAGESIIPNEMLLSPENSIVRTQVDTQENDVIDEEISEELSEVSSEYPIEDCNPLS